MKTTDPSQNLNAGRRSEAGPYQSRRKFTPGLSLLAACLICLLCAIPGPARAGLNVQSDGSDGPLIVTNNLVIDLNRATVGNWNLNNQTNAGNGVYDPQRWAVVFKYTYVIIYGGATVTFINNSTRAPVVWLVQGDVQIDGTVSLNGQDAVLAPLLAEPGP